MPEDPNNPNPGGGTPAPAPTGLTQADLHNAAEKARIEERTKLRGELDAAIAKSKELEGQVGTLTSANQKLTADSATLQSSLKPEGGVDVNKLIESVVTRVNNEWAGKFSKLDGELQVERNTRQKLTVEQLRARLISQHGGENAMIPELVTGDNETEILAAIEASKLKYAGILARVGGASPSQQPTNGQPGAGQPPPPMNLPQGGGPPAPGAPQGGVTARNMTRQEFASKRDELKKKAAQRYPANYVTQ